MKQTRLRSVVSIAGLLAVVCLYSSIAGAQTYKTLFRFPTTGKAGLSPNPGLVFDAVGNLYGTTQSGGSCSSVSSGCGVVFEMSTNGVGGWSQKIIYTFLGGSDGSDPQSGVVFDAAGNLYGTTASGGASSAGTIYELSPNGVGGWTEQVLYSFSGGTTDGGFPSFEPTLDAAGDIFNATPTGGANSQGALVELVHSGSTYTPTVVLAFNKLEGTGPSPLTFDAYGDIYGTATNGGHFENKQHGTIYELFPNGSGGWDRGILFTFQSLANTGIGPGWGIVFDPFGNIYGQTTKGAYDVNGGIVYELSSSLNESVVLYLDYSLAGGEHNYTTGPLTIDSLGNVYGAIANYDRSYYPTNDGFIFRSGPSGPASYTFPALLPSLRFVPLGGLAVDGAGNVYGVTQPQGGNARATVFELTF